jgi:hypothetical protein
MYLFCIVLSSLCIFTSLYKKRKPREKSLKKSAKHLRHGPMEEPRAFEIYKQQKCKSIVSGPERVPTDIFFSLSELTPASSRTSAVRYSSGNVHSSLGANTHLVLGVCLEETLNTTAGELEVMEVSD